ncbi:MAG: TatD family hydrolase [Acidobacteria bacterium]|nr:TatD family hydrolase [Acidobacteriota bacterium]
MTFRATALVDSHCHVQNLPEGDRERALDAARERGVEGFLLPAIRLADAEGILAFCHAHEGVWCALGVHPHEAASWQPGDEKRLASLLSDPKAVAVGECGLDFYYDHAPRPVQHEVMRAQWTLALELGLPVVVHNRDSNDAMVEEAVRPEHEGLEGVFHSFAGGAAMARQLLAKDYYLGFTGMVTFPKADNVREVLPLVPHDRLLVETDTPYLAPVPYRGKRNEPAYVVEVAERVAKELELSFEELTRRTTENFFRLFPKAAA